ncbi:MAG: hypothetical protein OEL76_13175 [Siculibacillus sp.]|nr:hypothetical protein [Siculibacillus sp.]
MNRFVAFGAFFVVPTAAFAMPFFNHTHGEAGYFLDVTNGEDRAYECRVAYDFTVSEDGTTATRRLERTLAIPPRWSGRMISMPSTARTIVRGYRYDISCN